MMNFFSKGLLLLALTLGLLAAASADVYIRNKSVDDSKGLYVSRSALEKYFTTEELERCLFDPASGQITVDGVPLPETYDGDHVPVVLLAEALGFQKRVNKELGITDYFPAAALEKPNVETGAGGRKGGEYQAAEARMQNVLRKTPMVSTHPQLQRVETIGAKIAAASDMPRLQWNFLIVASPEANAFCTGPGWVAVTEGLLGLNLSDDELAGVLAHEVGHGCGKDIEERQYNVGAMQGLETEIRALHAQRIALITKRDQLLAKARRSEQLAVEIGPGSTAASLLQDSRQAESEASQLEHPIKKLEKEIEAKAERWSDHKDFATASIFRQKVELDADVKGLYYATTAGYSHDGLMSALTKVAGAGAATFGEAAYQGGYDHPPLGDRIKTMQKVLADWRKR